MWYVEYLLLFGDAIRSEGQIESDIYDDLMSVELALKSLVANEELDSKDIQIINTVTTCKSIREASRNMGYPVMTVARRFTKVCKLIANRLGGIFTDEGYLQNIAEKYSLCPEQIEILRQYMKSNVRQELIENPYRRQNEFTE